MKVRAKALSNLGKTALAKEPPMAMLEDVLVPLSFTGIKLRLQLK
jgi:hypothetical protein